MRPAAVALCLVAASCARRGHREDEEIPPPAPPALARPAYLDGCQSLASASSRNTPIDRREYALAIARSLHDLFGPGVGTVGTDQAAGGRGDGATILGLDGVPSCHPDILARVLQNPARGVDIRWMCGGLGYHVILCRSESGPRTIDLRECRCPTDDYRACSCPL